MIELHRLLLADGLRNDAFKRALKSVIVKGQTVVADIGSGTGYLSFLAEKLGAKECHLYETSELLEISKTLAKENGMKRCHFYRTHSTAVKNPHKADVVVSETLGNYALEENIIETLSDAQRFLKPGGVVIPSGLKQFAAPVINSRLHDDLNPWDHVGDGLTFAAAKHVGMNNMYVKEISPEDLLGSGECWDTIAFGKKNSSIRDGTIEWTLKKDETLYGFALWWEAMLTKGIRLLTSPFSKPTHWKQIYLPFVEPLQLKKGQTIRLKIHSDSRYQVKINVAWETTVLDAKGKTVKNVKQDMRKGYIA